MASVTAIEKLAANLGELRVKIEHAEAVLRAALIVARETEDQQLAAITLRAQAEGACAVIGFPLYDVISKEELAP